MHPLSQYIPSTLPPKVYDFVTQTSNNTHEAWAKGIAFGFRDCHIWYGLELKELRTPRTNTHKHPLKDDCYVRISQQSSRKSTTARKDLEQAFSSDFEKARQIDKLDPDEVITPFLDYDSFIHRAAQLIPEGKTIPECIFGPFVRDTKNWPRDHAEVKKSLSWLVDKMTVCQKQESLIFLLATWVELSSAMAMQRLGCMSLHGKAYFDWSEVFAYARNPDLLPSASPPPTPSVRSVGQQTTPPESGSSITETVTQSSAVAANKETSATEETIVPISAIMEPIQALNAKPPAAGAQKNASDEEIVPSKETKSGRTIKPKTGLEIEFPPVKRRKFTPQYL